jgi:hypothetical protein
MKLLESNNEKDKISHLTDGDINGSSSDSDEEVLPYPYNKLPEDRWYELKHHLKKVN